MVKNRTDLAANQKKVGFCRTGRTRFFQLYPQAEFKGQQSSPKCVPSTFWKIATNLRESWHLILVYNFLSLCNTQDNNWYNLEPRQPRCHGLMSSCVYMCLHVSPVIVCLPFTGDIAERSEILNEILQCSALKNFDQITHTTPTFISCGGLRSRFFLPFVQK